MKKSYDTAEALCLESTLRPASDEEYSSSQALNQSMLKDVLRVSPFYAHHRARVEKREETPAMKIGTALHCKVLEPKKYGSGYAVLPEGLDRRKTEHKALYNEFMEANAGRILLKHEESELINSMAESVAPLIKPRKGAAVHVEEAIFGVFSYEVDGIHAGVFEAKGRLDMAVFEENSIVIRDIKTVASLEDVPSTSYHNMWALQAAYYVDLIEKSITPPVPVSFEYYCVSKEAPHDARVFVCSDEMLCKGRKLYAKAIAMYGDWLSMGKPSTSEFFGVQILNG
jgi:hypothetical protein